jgi:hypothetical protein
VCEQGPPARSPDHASVEVDERAFTALERVE